MNWIMICKKHIYLNSNLLLGYISTGYQFGNQSIKHQWLPETDPRLLHCFLTIGDRINHRFNYRFGLV